MLRRLHPDQPDSFKFTPANAKWAKAQMTKFPAGRQASAVIPLLWRAQEQEGWVTKPAIEHIADMLDMAYIRVLEVASFYFMFQLKPVGAVAHIQVCGTTSCMICGAEDLIGVCKDMIAKQPHQISENGKFSWEEVECLGACSNAPMVQIGKDFYEDLTEESFRQIIYAFDRGEVPTPGPQNGRFAAEPLGGATTLKDFNTGKNQHNASAALATGLGDTVKRIDGTEVPLLTPWKGTGKASRPAAKKSAAKKPAAKPAAKTSVKKEAAKSVAKPKAAAKKPAAKKASKPKLFTKPPKQIDDLKLISGVGPKLENTLHEVGVYQFSQVASWTKADISFVDDRLSFKGRIERDQWVKQAKKLMKG